MRRFAFLSILLFSCGVTNRASALYLSFGCTDPALSTDITYEQTGSLSFNRIVEVANPSQTNISILSWQTEYKLNPIGGASGQLSFTAVATPPSPVLTNFGGPQTTLTVPSDYLLAFDANIVILEPTLIPAGERRNIMEITITASPDASGDFQLVTPAFSPPDVGSTWFPDLASGPGPFENTLASGQAGFLLLATIHIINNAYPLGDYNRDHNVNEADYQRWREDFSSSVALPGDGADGNRDGVVNAADYVIWRQQFHPGTAAALAGSVAIPEPSSLVSALAALAVWSAGIRMIGRRNECAPSIWHSNR